MGETALQCDYFSTVTRSILSVNILASTGISENGLNNKDILLHMQEVLRWAVMALVDLAAQMP